MSNNSIPDAWRAMLDAQLVVNTGHRSDDWYALLDDLAPPEIGRQMNDLELWFWDVSGGVIELLRYEFNGIDMFATMPGWVPNGLPYTIAATAQPLTTDGTLRRIVSGAVSPSSFIGGGVDLPTFTYEDIAGNPTFIPIPPAATAEVLLDTRAIMSGEETEYTVNGTSAVDIVARSITQPAVTNIASNGTGTENWHGPMARLALVDDSPFQRQGGRPILLGDNTRYIAIPEIVISGDSDYEINFSWIRQDRTGTGNQIVCEDFGSESRLVINDTLNANPNRIALRRAGGQQFNFTDALEDVAQGQHIRIRITVTAIGTGTIFIDDVQKGLINSAQSAPFIINTLYSRTTNNMANGAAAGDFVFSVADNYVKYKIDEGDGLTVLAYDIDGDEIIGEELNTNVDFTLWVDPTVPDGWTKAGTHDGTNFVEENANGMRLVSDGTFTGVNYNIPGNPLGSGFNFVIVVDSITSGVLRFVFNGINHDISTPGTHLFYTDSLTGISISLQRASGSTDLVVRSASFKETSNGLITPDFDWGSVAYNSRYYPMDEGTGDTFLAYTDNTRATPDPANNATIQNFDEANWKEGNPPIRIFITTEAGDILTTEAGDSLIT